MTVTPEIESALINLLAIAKVAVGRELVSDDGSIETLEQFLFDLDVEPEKFEAFPRLSAEDIEEDRQKRKEEKEHYADYSDQKEEDL